MSDLYNIRESYDNVQFNVFLMPDYDEERSCLIIKAHHSFTDGMGFASFFLILSNNFNGKNLGSIKPLSWTKKVLVVAAIPFLIMYELIALSFTPADVNYIRK